MPFRKNSDTCLLYNLSDGIIISKELCGREGERMYEETDYSSACIFFGGNVIYRMQ